MSNLDARLRDEMRGELTGSRSLVTCRAGADAFIAELPSYDLVGITGST